MRQSGLTLVEVALAMALCAIVFALLANTQVNSAKITRDSEEASLAMAAANAVVEAVSAQIYPQIADYYLCGSGIATVECKLGGALADGYSYSAVVTGLFVESSDPMLDPRTPDEFQNEGLVRIDVDVVGPAAVSFTAYVSCYDVAADLTLEEGEPCPDPYDPDEDYL